MSGNILEVTGLEKFFGGIHVTRNVHFAMQGANSRRSSVRPSLLLLDEPVEGVAPVVVQELTRQIKSLKYRTVPTSSRRDASVFRAACRSWRRTQK